MRLVIAIVMGAGILVVGIATLRGLGGGAPGAPQIEAVEPIGARATFWCEACGTEVLLLRKGTDHPPRHCGEPMIKREEVPRE